ncbi:MAG: hypothetical protein LLG14_11310 [Nocardiaceae bacterium]|nr:hypothetical protein [Nocardiaceae bacterium]
MFRRTIWWALPLIVAALCIAGVTFAQELPGPPDVAVLVQAINLKQWWLVAAGAILTAIYALRGFTGIWDKIPKNYRPAVVGLLGVVSGVCQAIFTGQPWLNALVGGLMSAAVAISTDQILSKTLSAKPAQTPPPTEK